jgi:hypothetical protein
VTASGRQVRPARTGIYGESLLSGQADTPDYAASETSRTSGRATRNSTRLSPLHEDRKRKSRGYNSLDDDSEEDAPSSGNEWDGGDDDDNEEDDVDMADGDDEDDMDLDQHVKRSLIVKLKVSRPQEQQPVKTEPAHTEENPPPATDASRVSVARQDLENLSTKDETAPAPPTENHPAAVDSMDIEVPTTQKTYHAHPPPAPLAPVDTPAVNVPAVNMSDQQQPTNGNTLEQQPNGTIWAMSVSVRQFLESWCFLSAWYPFFCFWPKAWVYYKGLFEGGGAGEEESEWVKRTAEEERQWMNGHESHAWNSNEHLTHRWCAFWLL